MMEGGSSGIFHLHVQHAIRFFVRLILTLKEWKNEGWRPCGIFHLHMQLLPRFMPLPVQCGKFQLQYEDTGNFEIDFREEFSQNIKTLNKCEKGDNTFTFLKLSLTQILDFFLVYFWCCQVAVLDGGGWRERERVDLRQKLLIEVASLWFPTVFNHSPKLAEMDLTIAEMELTSLFNMFMFGNL